MKKFNKQIICNYGTNTSSLGYAECFICKDDKYANVYIIDDVFQPNEINSLDQQIPLNMFNKQMQTDAFMHCLIMSKDLWNKFGHFNNNEFPYQFNIECYDSELNKQIF